MIRTVACRVAGSVVFVVNFTIIVTVTLAFILTEWLEERRVRRREEAVWTCGCGQVNTGNRPCSRCDRPRPKGREPRPDFTRDALASDWLTQRTAAYDRFQASGLTPPQIIAALDRLPVAEGGRAREPYDAP